MNTLLSRHAFTLTLLLIFIPLSSAQETPLDGKHLGTWKLLSLKYGDAADFTKYPDTSSRLKLLNATHFTWLEVTASTKSVVTSAGGTYKLTGNSYVETIEWAGEGMETYMGKPQKFTIRVEGDKLYQSGELSDGLKIEEIWERVK